MTNRSEHRGWISKVRPRAVGVALIPAVVLVLGAVATESAQARTFTVLYRFCSESRAALDCRDGRNPIAGLVRDAAGNLYGTTLYGGNVSCNPPDGCGTVFKVTKSGKETVLYDFCSLPGCADGMFPWDSLVLDAAGNLYGTTQSGGVACNPVPDGCGTVFKVDANGKETVLHSFSGGTTDGQWPYAGLLRDTAGDFYGTTYYGGGTDCDSGFGCGTVFKLDTTGKETVLYSFSPNGAGGQYPNAGVVRDQARNLYGTTTSGGNYCYDDTYCGVVYKLSRNGKETVLHSFSPAPDGCFPYGTPIIDKSGNLYGTTMGCGSGGLGTVWKVTKNGRESVLHSFAGSDGGKPWAGVIMDEKGNLYGDNVIGGVGDNGTVYELDKKGVLTVLHSFSGPDGGDPTGVLIRDAKGSLYGTAGTVWKLTP